MCLSCAGRMQAEAAVPLRSPTHPSVTEQGSDTIPTRGYKPLHNPPGISHNRQRDINTSYANSITLAGVKRRKVLTHSSRMMQFDPFLDFSKTWKAVRFFTPADSDNNK